MLNKALLPGYTTLGIINNGQGARNLALEARSAGFIVGMYTPYHDSNIAELVDFVVEGSFNDAELLRSFIKRCDVVTYTGTVINDQLMHYLKASKKIPQGTEILDLIHDRSIQHAFLDMIHVKSVPYRTVVGLDDIRRGIDIFGYPAILKPIQTSILNDRQLIIHNHVDISQAAGMLEVGTYVLEPELSQARHFSVLIVKSKDGSLGQFPMVETHYHNNRMTWANACPDLAAPVKQKLETEVKKVATQLHYIGGVEITLVCSKSRHIYVEGVKTPFDLASDLLIYNGLDIYQQALKALMGSTIHSPQVHISGVVGRVNRSNYQDFQKLWLQKAQLSLHIDRSSHFGSAFIMTGMPGITMKKLLADLKNR